MDELRVELFLQSRKPSTDRRLGNFEMSRRGRKAITPDDLDKSCNIVLICPHKGDKVAFMQHNVKWMPSVEGMCCSL